MSTVEGNQVQIRLICWRTKPFTRCGVFNPRLQGHFTVFLSGERMPHTELQRPISFPPLGNPGRHGVVHSRAPFLDTIPRGTWKWLLNMDRHAMFQLPQCSRVCRVSNLTSLNFNAPTCPLCSRLHDEQAEPSCIIHAPVASQFRWNSTRFARVENRL